MPESELQQLMRHMEWADARVWRAVRASPAARADGRLRELLHHVHTVQWAYLAIWRGEPPDLPEAATFDDAEAVRAWCRRYYDELATGDAGLEAERLSEEVRFPWADHIVERFGSAQPTTRLESVHQVLSHTTYHRGQVNARLREVGGEPPLVDFVAWIWMGRPEPAWEE